MSEPVKEWDLEQRACIDAALARECFMLMGVAGTGKSTVLKHIISSLRGLGKTVAVTATSGVAGEIIGSGTLHYYLGIGAVNPGVTLATLIKRVSNNKGAIAHWLETDVLIVEEVSALGPNLFQLLHLLAQHFRENDKPFGGMQLILCGDFFQNSPIGDKVNRKELVEFAYSAPIYRRLIVKHIELKTIYRQKDEEFKKILTEVRYSTLSPSSEAILRSRIGIDVSKDGIKPTLLYSHRKDVNKHNEKRLLLLGTPIHRYLAKDTIGKMHHEKKLNSSRFPEVLQLAVGAQVMLLVNGLAPWLVNGSRGMVVGFLYNGQPTSNPDFPTDFDNAELAVQVLFKNGIHTVTPSLLTVEDCNGNVTASRLQFPLNLAWASTIHKAQGSQLDCVKIKMAGIFSSGMFYVALSRATSLEGLSLKDFDRSKITTHPGVLKWYQNNFESKTSESYTRYCEKLKGTSTFELEEVRDFFVLYRRKYFPLLDPNKIGERNLSMIQLWLNRMRNLIIFECHH